MYARSIKFTTTNTNEDILKLTEVREVLKSMLSCDSEEELNAVVANGIDTNVDVFTSETRIQINGTTYNDLIEDAVYSTNNISKIYSVVAETPATGVIVFTMADK